MVSLHDLAAVGNFIEAARATQRAHVHLLLGAFAFLASRLVSGAEGSQANDLAEGQWQVKEG